MIFVNVFFCFIGREKNVKISQLFPEVGNLGLVLPEDLSKWTTEKVRKGQQRNNILLFWFLFVVLVSLFSSDNILT